MFTQILIRFALGCIAFANTRSVQDVNVVSCKASEEVVHIGEPASITCHFPFDISQMTSVWVTVGFFPDKGPEKNQVELVDCMKHKTSKPECKVLKEGYSMDRKVETSLKLHISNISAQHSGRYLCQIMTTVEERVPPKAETCSLSVRKVVTCKASPERVKIGDIATVTCHFPDDVSQMSSVSVTVGHYPENEPEREYAVALVECTKTNRLEPECTVSKGYVIEGAVTTSLKLRMPNISAQHFGRFLCRMLPAEGEDIPISEMCSFSVLGSDVEDQEETNSVQIIAPLIVFVVLMVAAGILVIQCNQRFLKCVRSNAGQKDSRESPQGGSTLDMTVNVETVCDPLLGNTNLSEYDPPAHPPHGDIPTTEEQQETSQSDAGSVEGGSGDGQGGSEALQTITAAVSEENTVRLLLVGGPEKRATGNTILGRECFKTDQTSVTGDCERHVEMRDNTRIEIMDSPGLFAEMKNPEEICTAIIQSVAGMHPGPHAILYVIKAGPHSKEDLSAFTRLKDIFDNDIIKYIIIVLTQGDMAQPQRFTLTRMFWSFISRPMFSSPEVPTQLNKQVLRQLGNRYILFNNNSEDKQIQVEELLKMVGEMTAENRDRPYSCPKYSMIGEGLEEEVRKRMAKYEERELQTNKYHQNLKAVVKDDFEMKDSKREEEARKVQDRRKKLEQDLKDQQALREDNIQRLQKSTDALMQRKNRLKQEVEKGKKKGITMPWSTSKQQLEETERKERQMQDQVEQQRRDDEQKTEAERKQVKRQEQEEMKLQEEHEQQRRQDMEEMDTRNREVEEMMAREREVQRERQCRTEMERQREMDELKSRVAEQKEPDFLEAVMDDVKSIVTALSKAKK